MLYENAASTKNENVYLGSMQSGGIHKRAKKYGEERAELFEDYMKKANLPFK